MNSKNCCEELKVVKNSKPIGKVADRKSDIFQNDIHIFLQKTVFYDKQKERGKNRDDKKKSLREFNKERKWIRRKESGEEWPREKHVNREICR